MVETLPELGLHNRLFDVSALRTGLDRIANSLVDSPV